MRNRQKLHKFARRYDIPLVNYSHPVVLRNKAHSPRSYVSDENKKAAELLLLGRRVADPDYKPPSTLKRTFSRSKPTSPLVFDNGEVNRGLEAAIISQASVGVVQALLWLGGNVNIVRHRSGSLVKKILKSSQVDERSDLLCKAVTNCSYELVECLSEEADQTSLDEALGVAIRRADLRIVRLLLEFGANLDSYHDEFQSIVRAKAEDMAELFIMAPKPPCQLCHDAALEIAIGVQSHRILSLLALTKANADYQDAKAFQDAIAMNNRTFVLTMLLSCQPPSIPSLDKAVPQIYSKIGHGQSEENVAELVEMLLCAGATGPCTSKVLLHAVKQNRMLLVQTLLDYGVSVDYEGGAAIESALVDGNESMVAKLLAARPNAISLSNSIRSTRLIDDVRIACDMIKMLVSADARGDAVSDAMVDTIRRLTRLPTEDERAIAHETLRILIYEGEADVNFNDGAAIQIAVSVGDSETVQMLLNEKVNSSSLVSSFSAAMALEDKSISIQVVQSLLAAGAAGYAVDEALISSIAQGLPGLKLTTILIKTASVDYKNGKALCTAIAGYHVRALELLLDKNPTKGSLDFALNVSKLLAGSERQTATALLLGKGLMQKSLDVALFDAVRELKPDHLLIQMYLDAGALPDFDDGVCIIHAAKAFDADLLCILSQNITTTDIFSRAFDEVVQSHTQWYLTHNLPVIKILLERGAGGVKVSNSVCWAACTLRLEVLQTFAEAIVWHPAMFTLAFSQVIQANNRWLSKEGVEVILVLLHRGASGEQIDIALVRAVQAYCSGQPNDKLIDVLLKFDASVNYGNGEAVQLAAEYGNNMLLMKLIRHGATRDTVGRALSIGIVSQHEEGRVQDMLEVMAENSNHLDVNFVYPDMDPPLYLCLKSYPNSTALCQRFCELGANLETKVSCQVYSSEMGEPVVELKPEAVPVLIWALVQPEMMISSEVIVKLIDNGANVNFVTQLSKTTALILAAKNRRMDVLRRLLDFNAKSAVKDLYDRSALFYTARNGDANSVHLLLQGQQKLINDGSLHEAARGFHRPVIELLTQAGHHPNFSSAKHEGRTALGELACRGRCPNDTSLAEEAVNALLAAKADPLKRSNGKSTIFLALDNIDPVPITKILVERILWEELNNEANIYKEGDYYYSPTMYIKKGVLLGPCSESVTLYRLLKAHQGEDRFYASMGLEQPPDAIGLPDEIKEFERSRKIREQKDAERQRRRAELEEDHLDLQRHQSEAINLKMRLAQAEHNQRLDHGDALATQRQHHRYVEHDTNMRLRKEDDHLTKQIRATDAQQLEAIAYRQARAQEYEGQRARELTLQDSRRVHQEKLSQLRSTADENLQIVGRQNSMALQNQHEREQLAWRMQSGQNQLALERDEARTRELRQQEINSVRAASAKHRLTSEELLMRQKTAVGMFQMDQVRAGLGAGPGPALGAQRVETIGAGQGQKLLTTE